MPHDNGLVLVPRGGLPPDRRQLLPPIATYVVLVEIVRVVESRRASEQKQVVSIRTDTLTIEFARRFLGIIEHAAPLAFPRVVLHDVGPQTVHLDAGSARHNHRVRRRPLTHAKGRPGMYGVSIGKGVLPTVSMEVEDVHVVEASDLVFVSATTAEQVGLDMYTEVA